MNLHAAQLERILLERGLTIAKEGRQWQIRNEGKQVVYLPLSGTCVRWDPLLGSRRREELRGSPDRVAEILEGFVR